MLQGITQRQRGTQRLTAHKPAVDAEEMADHFEFGDVRVWRIGGRIVGGRRPGVAEQLDHNRAEVGGERFEVEDPVGAAGQEAVDEEQVWPRLPMYLEVEERLASSQSAKPLCAIEARLALLAEGSDSLARVGVVVGHGRLGGDIVQRPRE